MFLTPVYFRFNFEPVFAGATASWKSVIITRFTGMVKTVRFSANSSYKIIFMNKL